MNASNHVAQQEFLRFLNWSEGFGLVFIFASPATINTFRRNLPTNLTIDYLVPTSSLNVSKSVYIQLVKNRIPKQKNPLWIELLQTTPEWTGEITQLLANLNGARELLRKTLQHPIIFVFSPYHQTQIREIAPDLWSIRNVTLYLEDERDNQGYLQKIRHAIGDIYGRFSFPRAYRNLVIYQHRVFNIKGLRTRGEYSIELEHVFVELRITPSSQPNQPHRDLLTAKELQGSQPIWEFLRYGRKRQEQLLLAIIGAPGCGKTTLLQHVALQFATQAPNGLPKWIPILLFLRQQVKTILAERPALGDLVQQHFSDSKRYPNLQPPAHWFQQQLNAGNCLILLDGLDEVANAEERQQISTWIDEQTVNYPLCPFVVTSRPQGYHAAPLARATIVLEVQAFTTAQVNQFIKSWYLATEIMSFGGKDDPGVRLRAAQEAEDLQLRLQKHPSLQDLTVNPLLLTMITMVHRYRGQLPGRRVELYAEICDVLLGHWREAKGIQDSLTAAQKRVALQPLAAWMMENSVHEIESYKVLEIIAEPLKMLGITDGQTFLKDIQASSGLLLEKKNMDVEIWHFVHSAFREYLAAAHYKDQKIHGNWWHRKVTDSWWWETLLLYAAQADATPIVKSCLNLNNSTALILAADCLEEALQLDAAVRQQVETRLIANLESDDPELFKLAAEVKLQRRLRNLQRIDEHREIDRTFISCAEYQLFLDEMRAKEEYYQPDHWVEFRFPKNSATQPIAGVRAQDAKWFYNWLSQKENKKYRCPTLIEAQDFSAIEYSQLSTWCRVYGGYDLQWNSLQTQQNIDSQLKNYFKDCQLINKYGYQISNASVQVDSGDNIRPARISFMNSLNIPSLDIGRATAFDLILTDIIISVFEDEQLKTLVKSGDFTAAIERLQKLPIITVIEQRRKNLLVALLSFQKLDHDKPRDIIKYRQEVRKYVAYVFEYSIIECELLENEEYASNNGWWQRLLFWRKKKNYTTAKRKFASLYAWTKIVEARQNGELPAWEGIRIVRERDV